MGGRWVRSRGKGRKPEPKAIEWTREERGALWVLPCRPLEQRLTAHSLLTLRVGLSVVFYGVRSVAIVELGEELRHSCSEHDPCVRYRGFTCTVTTLATGITTLPTQVQVPEPLLEAMVP